MTGCVAVVIVLTLADSASAAFPGRNGRIVFAGGAGHTAFDIYTVNPDGSGRMQLTRAPQSDVEPAWSPDGTKIAFTTLRHADPRSVDQNMEIYVMNADGSHQTRLTNEQIEDHYPAWSPNGKQIVYVRGIDETADLWVMNANGTNKRRLTSEEGQEIEPVWSPDGKKIAYLRFEDGNYDIFTINADGSGKTQLTKDPVTFRADMDPDWSPDSRRIVFQSETYDTIQHASPDSYDIYAMNADGSGRRQLTRGKGMDTHPAWSPDGKKIVFARSADNASGIYVMNADGSGQTRIAEGDWPDWQPVARAAGGVASKPEAKRTATVGMPFRGKWAYNVSVRPPYSDENSSHPSVHHTYYGDWATDLYAATGTPVKLHVTSKGALSFSLNRTNDSCKSAGANIAGRGIVLNVLVDGKIIGSVDFEHLDGISSGPYANGMTIGRVTSEPFAKGCYTARHAHVELKNAVQGSYACWSDHGNPGVTLDEGAPIGILGASSKQRRQSC